MAELNLDPAIHRLRGRLGNFVYKQRGDRKYIAKRPSSPTGTPSAAQQAVRDKFKRAANYGRSVMADPLAKAFYAAIAEARQTPLFSVCVEDYFKAPTVNAVDLSGYNGNIGEKIMIEATDDCEVKSVVVEISTANGGVVETNPAVLSQANPGFWEYTATADATGNGQISVKVTASDRPGNKTTRTETK
ncbi:MAG: hypothetical protein ABI623_06925 [bacterium]